MGIFLKENMNLEGRSSELPLIVFCNDKSSLVSIIAWSQAAQKLLSKPVKNQHADTHINGLMQKRCTSSANALELHLFCIKP